MPIIIKTRREIEMMRQAGQLANRILTKMAEQAKVGVTTAELNEIARVELEAAGAVGLSKGYTHAGVYKPGDKNAYPAETCISINEVVVHGIPGPRQLQDGDLVTVDLALSLEGYCADSARTVAVGNASPLIKRLISVTESTFDLAMRHMKPGKKWSEIARLMQHHVESAGFNVVREFVGHGVGRSMHEDPKVPNFIADDSRGDFKLRPGMTIAVEPMVVAGSSAVGVLKDQWTVVTEDRKPSSHYEHTVAVTDAGVDILTDGHTPFVL